MSDVSCNDRFSNLTRTTSTNNLASKYTFLYHIGHFPIQTSYPLLLTRISNVRITHAHTVCMHSYTPTQITNFLNRQDVQQDLGVKRTWEPCKPGIELLVHILYLGSVVYSFTG